MSRKKVSLDTLLDGELPAQAEQAVRNITLTVEEVTRWESSKPPFLVEIGKTDIRFEIRFRIKTRKVMTITGGLLGAIAMSLLTQWLMPYVILAIEFLKRII